MNWLITSDPHLSDRTKDHHRFDLFKWLVKQQQKYNVDATFILGDLTENKDRHSGALLNKVVEGLTTLKPPVYVLRGNHDGIDPDTPYFKFLNMIEGLSFVTSPYFDEALGVGFVPHCLNQQLLDKAASLIPPVPKAIMLHQTFEGAKSEGQAGMRLTGLKASPIEICRAKVGVYSGDVHKPQRHGCVTYIGSPYHIKFGDNFTPRVLLVKNGVEQNLYFECPHKWALTINDENDLLNNEELHKGDQAKLTVEIDREEVVEWQEHKKRILSACKQISLEVFGIELKVNAKRRKRIKLDDNAHVKSASEVVNAFCTNESVAVNIKKAGLELLK